jgi:hypothetical protein
VATRAFAASSYLTWVLALIFLAALDAGITRTAVLWGPTAFERTEDPGELVFAQAYRAARVVYHPEREAALRVALLGSSKILLASNGANVEKACPGLDLAVENLGIFGTGLAEIEMLSRHLVKADWKLVVLTLSASDLLRAPENAVQHPSVRLLRIGWADGPIPPSNMTTRIDRWLRTLWPLYRFREFSRAALHERVIRPPLPPQPRLEHGTTREVFTYVNKGQADAIERAYRAWLARRDFASYLEYLSVGRPGYLEGMRERVKAYTEPTPESAAVRSLEAFLARAARAGWNTRVLLMPRNPVLGLDVEQEFHDAAMEERAIFALESSAERHGVPLIDGRAWVSAEDFLDINHPMPGLSGFDERLAEEIRHVVEG